MIEKLYPLKFSPILKSVIWGGEYIKEYKNIITDQTQIGESWEISAIPGSVSVVSEGNLKGCSLNELINKYGETLLGEKVFETYGSQFPLLIKFIDAKSDLSIQVHPNEKLAQQREHKHGKTEMWYIIKAEQGAGLYSGFSEKITPDEYETKVADNTFTDTLNFSKVNPGDVYFLPAGRVHAIGKGVFLAEIQQSSDITYRIFDYNRRDKDGNLRELHTELAKAAIDYEVYEDYQTHYTETTDKAVTIADCPYFQTDLLELTKDCERDYSDLDSFVILMCMEGNSVIDAGSQDSVELRQGETVLIPASLKKVNIKTDRNVKLLEVYIP